MTAKFFSARRRTSRRQMVRKQTPRVWLSDSRPVELAGGAAVLIGSTGPRSTTGSTARALEAGSELAQKIAACGPLGIKTTLESAHLSIDESEAAAFAKLGEQFGGLFHTGDFIEGGEAEAEGPPPVYQGK
jgi:hypothetical protein